jgi:DNA-binding XRE family transcriptional regulator
MSSLPQRTSRKGKKYKLLRERMRELEMSQDELARAVAMSISAFNLRINGRLPWNLDEAYAVLTALSLPLSKVYEYFPPKGDAPNAQKRRDRVVFVMRRQLVR